MLSELTIIDFAIIDRLRLQLAPGFNVLTGETGAGKSIIIDAVSLLLGSKADSDAVRAGCDRALVEGVFELNLGDSEVLTMFLAIIACGYAAADSAREPSREAAVV